MKSEFKLELETEEQVILLYKALGSSLAWLSSSLLDNANKQYLESKDIEEVERINSFYSNLEVSRVLEVDLFEYYASVPITGGPHTDSRIVASGKFIKALKELSYLKDLHSSIENNS